ncbi:MAG: hypothetical protein IAF08_13105 [Rhizobacter sp.]|nr:hypothetical protein [Chlorobiales bacterium]
MPERKPKCDVVLRSTNVGNPVKMSLIGVDECVAAAKACNGFNHDWRKLSHERKISSIKNHRSKTD